MIVMQIVSVHMKKELEEILPYSSYLEVQQWLTQWTCRANFKAVLAEDVEGAIEHCQRILREQLIPGWLRVHGVKPSMFTFQVSYQTVGDSEFWMSSSCVWIHDHEIPEE